MFTWSLFPFFLVITEDREVEVVTPQIVQTGNFVNNTYPDYIHIYVHVCMHMCICLCMYAIISTNLTKSNNALN